MSKAMLLFKDLLTEIQILEIQLKAVEREYKNIYETSLMVSPKGVNAVDYSSERVSGGLIQIPAYDAIGKLGDVMNRYNEINKELQEKYVLRDEIQEHMQQFEGIDKKVAYMRLVENKPLTIIADELKYSYDYIRKVNSRLERSQSGHKKVAKC
ncbi:hypothetical protein [Alkalihalophilus marmarensis]|uniref:hypothetical protein n=1 Tax=Alkalihalophilus marmarensis TaxID=521377 RepID=UPI002E224267|nr:hypothetical protein [Alkalihalophilus marmarensis]